MWCDEQMAGRLAADGMEIAAVTPNKLAELLATDVLRAAAAQGRGAIELTDNDAAAALDPLRRAFELWTRLDAPFAAARVRVLIARACRTLGDTDGEHL